MMLRDPLDGLVDLPGVREAAAAGRSGVDSLLWDRSLVSKGQVLATRVALRNAHASAVIDGIEIAVPAWNSGDAFDDSPLGRAAAGIWRLEQNLRELAGVWAYAPSQALARMHTLVAVGMVSDEHLGRPRSSDDVVDPLRIKSVVPYAEVAGRLNALVAAVTRSTSMPAVIEAGLVHGEILALRPFSWGSGPIARAAMRLVMAHRGLDPDLLVMTDVGIANLGRPVYVNAIRAYLTGSPEGVAQWLCLCADSIGLGAGFSVSELGAIG